VDLDDARVAAAAPVSQRAVDSVELDDADDELLRTITGADPDRVVIPLHRTSGRRLRIRLAKAGVAGVAVLALTAAGWATLHAHTGLFGGGRHTEEGLGELIRLDAPDAGNVIDGVAAHIPLPPGGTFDQWKARALRNGGASHRGAVMTETGIASALALDASCQWTAYWLAARGRGDTDAAARAQHVLDAIPGWADIAAADGDGTVRRALQRRADGTRADDPGQFLQEYTTNCPSP
jgi:hypothetical protein